MEKIKFSDFKIIPDINSVRKEDIDDNTYFSNAYSGYISNSRLKWIDPNEGGDPQKFKSPPKLKTQSLSTGSYIHELLLQPQSFELIDPIGKPTAKLGDTMDYIEIGINEGLSLDDAIRNACVKADYYANQIDAHLDDIKNVWNEYSPKLQEVRSKCKGLEQIIVSDRDWNVVNSCVESCLSNKNLMDKLHPLDVFGDPLDSYCEDALFMNFIVTYKGRYCTTLKFKLKIDNWTIDFDNKVLTLNDLKTTGKSVSKFMDPGMSFDHYCYFRQFFCYSEILWYYCMKNFGVSKEQGWKFKSNVLVVETIPNYWSRVYYVTAQQLQKGRKQFNELMSRVAYYDIFGWDKEVEFE